MPRVRRGAGRARAAADGAVCRLRGAVRAAVAGRERRRLHTAPPPGCARARRSGRRWRCGRCERPTCAAATSCARRTPRWTRATASRRSAARPTRRSPDVLTVSRMRAGGPWTRRWHVPSTGASSTACPSIRRRRRDRSTFMRAYQTLISPAGGRGPSSGLGVAGHTDMYTTPGTIGMATAESLPESQQRGVEGRRRVRKTQDELKTSRAPSTGP